MNTLTGKAGDTIAKYEMLKGGETVLVSVSGGPDSLALLHILIELAPGLGLNLHVFHLNHLMRGAAAAEDAEFVAAEAARLGLPATILAADVPAFIKENGLSPEDGARTVRREVCELVAAEIEADCVALGHTADDRVETFLMRVVRGAGLDGLRSIPPVNGMIIRPLIESSREDVEEYCAARGLAPRIDESNEDRRITRNRVRHELIPLLERDYNPGLRGGIIREIESIEEDRDYLESVCEQALTELVEFFVDSAVIDRQGFLALPEAIQRRVVRAAALRLTGQPQPLGFTHVDDVIRHVARGNSGSQTGLPGGLSARREYDTIVLQLGSLPSSSDWGSWKPRALKIPGVTTLAEGRVSIEAAVGEGPCLDKSAGADVGFIDAGKIGGKLTARPAKPGDAMRPLGLNGAKKVSDIFTDEKVARSQRENAVVVESGGTIVWLAGYRIDDSFKITADTKRTIILNLTRGSR